MWIAAWIQLKGRVDGQTDVNSPNYNHNIQLREWIFTVGEFTRYELERLIE